jgi:hypothetical protein
VKEDRSVYNISLAAFDNKLNEMRKKREEKRKMLKGNEAGVDFIFVGRNSCFIA